MVEHSGGWVSDLATRLAAEPDWRVPLGEALDGFYRLWPDRAAMADALDRPPDVALAPFPDALLAATVEQLAAQWGLLAPPWVATAGRRLGAPVSLAPTWFPANRLRRAPAPFRERRLLCDPDPLRRARRPPLPARLRV